MVWESSPVWILYMWLFSFPNTIYWRGCLFPVIYFCLLSLVNWPYKLEFICLTLISVSVFMPAPCCFDCCSLYYCLKSGNMIPPVLFFFLLNVVLTIWGFFMFSCKFLDILFYFCEKCYWYFDRDCTESVNCFG